MQILVKIIPCMVNLSKNLCLKKNIYYGNSIYLMDIGINPKRKENKFIKLHIAL